LIRNASRLVRLPDSVRVFHWVTPKSLSLIRSGETTSLMSLPGLRISLLCAMVTALIGAGCAGRLRPAAPRAIPPAPAEFTATAYCTGTLTATGTRPAAGTVAADPAVLRMGSRIRLAGLAERYNGVYTVVDTGPNVRGHHIDLYIRDCQEAIRFGRRQVSVLTVQ
jgi:3D (Asp-Asp-Asp) domain-containing protein